MAIQTMATAWDQKALHAFDESAADIFLLEQPSLGSFENLMANARLGSGRSPLTTSRASNFIRRVLARLDLDQAELVEDMTDTFLRFIKQYRLKEANLLVECTNQRNCPTFHCDNLHVRMVKTYFGPTTEYTYVAEPGVVHDAPAAALVFLKGRRHRNHADSVHHRSPEVPFGGKRLCLIVDF